MLIEKKARRFVYSGNDYRKFYAGTACLFRPPVVDRSGGSWELTGGIAGYTVGQRRGLGLTAAVPLYVLEIRALDNTLVVAGRKSSTNRE